jgi:ABC-type uncharacterized transport system fused permease/ATPase subunit
LEDFVLKYSWSAYGYLLSSLPVFLPAWGGLGGIQELADISVSGGRERGRMKEFITNKRLMLSLADAGGRMMYSIKDLSELAGYTSRVYTLISSKTFHNLKGRGQTNINSFTPSARECILSSSGDAPRAILSFRCARNDTKRL